MNGELYGLAGRAAQALGCLSGTNGSFLLQRTYLKGRTSIRLGLHCVRHGRAEDAESIFQSALNSIETCPLPVQFSLTCP